MKDTACKIRYHTPLPKEIMPNCKAIYRNPCKKCIVQACCSRPCRYKCIYESTIYWGKFKIQQIINTSVKFGIITLIIAAIIWGVRL